MVKIKRRSRDDKKDYLYIIICVCLFGCHRISFLGSDTEPTQSEDMPEPLILKDFCVFNTDTRSLGNTKPTSAEWAAFATHSVR